MIFYIVIPAYNEEAYISKTLQSLVEQTLLPKKIVVVNDGSTDDTQSIINEFAHKHPFISSIVTDSEKGHEPGAKIVSAFNAGLKTLDSDYDVICKFDADLIFSPNYLEGVSRLYSENSSCGIAGGFCTIEKNGHWEIEGLTGKAHIRGALKAYRKECFEEIGGLKNSMGWDTVDEFLALYHGWSVVTEESLLVKHLKPTGKTYTKAAKYLQGEALYKIRYGGLLTTIASAKLAFRKRSFSFFVNSLKGYSKAKKKQVPRLVSEDQGKFIRAHRWKAIRRKILG